MPSTSDPGALVAELRARLPDAAVSIDPQRLRVASGDVSSDEPAGALAVVAPADEDGVAAAVECCARHRVPLFVRGGGMSYTLGYVPSSPAAVILSTERLSRVVAVHPEDRVAVVEAGCTWEALAQALRPHGLECAIRGPISGERSTLGGAASQGLPEGTDGFLGFRVVLADGTRLATGAAALANGRLPFTRSVGPDVTGLFIGDCGALGVKTRVVVRLRPRPGHVDFASYGYDDAADLLAALAQLAASGLPVRSIGLENWRERRQASAEARHPLEMVRSALRRSGGTFEAVKQLTRLAASARVGHSRRWSLHVTAEGVDERTVAAVLARVAETCRAGEPIDAGVARAMHLRPYNINGIAGPDGERWLPVHGVLPPSRVLAGLERARECLDRHRAELDSHGVVTTMLFLGSTPQISIEPMLMWRDVRPPVVDAVLPERRLARWTPSPADPRARELVKRVRAELGEALRGAGAVHLQVGRYYPLGDMVEPGTRAFLARLRAMVDPAGTVSPGNLGIGAS